MGALQSMNDSAWSSTQPISKPQSQSGGPNNGMYSTQLQNQTGWNMPGFSRTSIPGGSMAPSPFGGSTVGGFQIPQPGSPGIPNVGPQMQPSGGPTQPNVPGYTGGWTPNYGNVGGVDLTPYMGQGYTINQLVQAGIITPQQAADRFGIQVDQFTNPSGNPQMQQDYQNWIKSNNFGPYTPPTFEEWYNRFGVGGTNIDSWSANDQQGLQTAFGNLNSQPNGGYVDNSGIYHPPDTSQANARYISGGQIYDGYGNVVGPAPSSANTPGNTRSPASGPINGQPGYGTNPPYQSRPVFQPTPYTPTSYSHTPYQPQQFNPSQFNPSTFTPNYNTTPGGSPAPSPDNSPLNSIASSITGLLGGGSGGGSAQAPGITKLSSSTLNGDIFSAPTTSQDYLGLRNQLQQYLMSNMGGANASAPQDPSRVALGAAPTVSDKGVGIQSADQLGAANSPFFKNMMSLYEPLFNQERANTITQANESAGNLVGSGFANTLGNKLNTSLASQQARIGDIISNYITQEQGRQGNLSNLAQTRNLADQNLAGQYGLNQGQLDQQRNLSVYDTNANLNNSNAGRLSSLFGQLGTAGVGQNELIQQGGLGALLGPLLGALGNSSLGSGLASGLGSLGGSLVSGLGNLAGGLGTGLGNLAGGLGSLGGNLAGGLTTGLGNLAGGLGDLGGSLVGGLGNLAGGLGNLGGNLAGGLGNLGGSLVDALGSLGGDLSGGLGLLAGGLGDLGGSLAGGLSDLAGGAANALGQIDWGNIGSILKGIVPDNLIGQVGSILQNIPGISDILGKIKNNIPTDISSITDALKKVGINNVGDAYNIVKQLANAGIIRGTAGQVLTGGKPGGIDWNSIIQQILGGNFGHGGTPPWSPAVPGVRL